MWVEVVRAILCDDPTYLDQVGERASKYFQPHIESIFFFTIQTKANECVDFLIEEIKARATYDEYDVWYIEEAMRVCCYVDNSTLMTELLELYGYKVRRASWRFNDTDRDDYIPRVIVDNHLIDWLTIASSHNSINIIKLLLNSNINSCVHLPFKEITSAILRTQHSDPVDYFTRLVFSRWCVSGSKEFRILLNELALYGKLDAIKYGLSQIKDVFGMVEHIFLNAVNSGNVELVRYLIGETVEKYYGLEVIDTGVSNAIKTRAMDVIRVIVETARQDLSLVVYNQAVDSECVEVIDYMRNYEPDENQNYIRHPDETFNEWKNALASRAIKNESCRSAKYMANAGANFYASPLKTFDPREILKIAVTIGDVDMVNKYIDVDITDDIKKVAIISGDLNVVKIVENASPLNADAALKLAITHGHSDLTSYFVVRASRRGRNDALDLAMINDNVEIVKLLIDSGADIEVAYRKIEYASILSDHSERKAMRWIGRTFPNPNLEVDATIAILPEFQLARVSPIQPGDEIDIQDLVREGHWHPDFGQYPRLLMERIFTKFMYNELTDQGELIADIMRSW